MITLSKICRYPVKGLSADDLHSVELTCNRPMPLDRKWGIIHSASSINSSNIGWVAKKNFLMLARDEKLGLISTKFDENGNILTIYRRGRQISRGALDDPMGRQVLQVFLEGFMPSGARGHPKIINAIDEDSFSDKHENYISIVNMESLKDLETRVIKQYIDPHRFRSNLYISGATAWSELNWVGKKINIGDVELEISAKTTRCKAINIAPDTGAVDMNIPLNLQKAYGHLDCGIYAKVIKSGEISIADEIILSD